MLIRVAILDPGFKKSGHHGDYFQHIIAFCFERPDVEVNWLVPSDGWWPFEQGDVPANLFPVRLGIPCIGSGFSGRFAEYNLLLDAAIDAAVSAGCTSLALVAGDGFQFSLARPKWRRQGISLTVLIFAPVSSNKLLNFRKLLQNLLMLSNNRVERVVVLNNEKYAVRMNKIGRKSKRRFVSVGDPYNPASIVRDGPRPTRGGELKILAFGSQGPRKNLHRGLLAAKHVAIQRRDLRVTFSIVGQFSDDDCFESILAASSEASEIENLTVVIDASFVDNETRDQLLRDSDVLFAAYIGFFGSSGIVTHSALHALPVVVSTGGVMAEVVEKYNLGESVDGYSVERIADGLEACSRHITTEENRLRFQADMSPLRFATQVLGLDD